MKVSELIKELDLKLVTKPDYAERDIEGCYISDLLSRVMSMTKQNDVWITVQTNINVVAVAVLTDVACIIVPEGIAVEHTTVEKADEKDVIILSSQLDSFALGARLGRLL